MSILLLVAYSLLEIIVEVSENKHKEETFRDDTRDRREENINKRGDGEDDITVGLKQILPHLTVFLTRRFLATR